MADQKQSPEFLGGGPKFNSVGRDNPPVAGVDEPMVPAIQTGYWLRVSAIVAVVIVLVLTLLFLSNRTPGKTNVQPAYGGHPVSPDAKDAVPADPNFK